MTFGSLFAGIGGMDLGLERAGMTVRWQVEIDPFCNRVLAKHWPNVVRHRDVREVGAHNLEPVDLICGGFPCQDISVAGGGAGLHGARSALWFEYLRILQELRPAWVLIENVPALRTRGIDTVLDGLGEAAYTTWPLVVGARHVGAPHRRDRVWIVAHRSGEGLEGRGTRASGAGAKLSQPSGSSRDGGLDDADARRRGRQDDAVRAGRHESVGVDAAVADANSDGFYRQRVGRLREDQRIDGQKAVRGRDAHRRYDWPSRPGAAQHEWEEPRTTEPSLGGATDGLSQRLAGRHRRAALKALGNSVVPQVVERIGRAILEAA